MDIEDPQINATSKSKYILIYSTCVRDNIFKFIFFYLEKSFKLIISNFFVKYYKIILLIVFTVLLVLIIANMVLWLEGKFLKLEGMFLDLKLEGSKLRLEGLKSRQRPIAPIRPNGNWSSET